MIDTRVNVRDVFDPIHPDGVITPGKTDVDFTINYKLLLVLKDTYTSWLTIFNANMNRIDFALHSIALRTSVDGEVPPEALEEIVRLSGEVVEIKESISTVENTIHQIEEQLVTLQTMQGDVSILKQNFVNLDRTVGAMQLLITSLQQDIQKLTANYEGLEQRVTAVEDKVLKLETLEARVQALEERS